MFIFQDDVDICVYKRKGKQGKLHEKNLFEFTVFWHCFAIKHDIIIT